MSGECEKLLLQCQSWISMYILWKTIDVCGSYRCRQTPRRKLSLSNNTPSPAGSSAAQCGGSGDIQIFESTSRVILAWYCICSTCTIVTFALPNPHPSRTTGEVISRMLQPDTPDVTDINSPAATAPPASKQAISMTDR